MKKIVKKHLTNEFLHVIMMSPLLEDFLLCSFLMVSKAENFSVPREVNHLNLPGGVQNESENNTRLQRMQAKKLRLYKEQEERS